MSEADIKLSSVDLAALFDTVAQAFMQPADAQGLLWQIGFPPGLIPNFAYDHRNAWHQVFRHLEHGVIAAGYRGLLTAAAQALPANEVLRSLAQRYLSPPPSPSPPPPASPAPSAVRHILVVGANPDGTQQLRGDRELKRIQQATRHYPDLRISHLPAAAATDLRELVSLRPDVLHLACHGDGTNLVFETAKSVTELVAAARVAELLKTYRQQARVELHAVVLNCCYSAGMAKLFTSVAEVVIGHRGELDDDCAAAFAGELYWATRETPSFGAAATTAAATAALSSPYCADLTGNLVVLPPV